MSRVVVRLTVLTFAALMVPLIFGAAGVLADHDPPDPIVPSVGEAALLDVVNDLPIQEIFNALDKFPVPYVVVAQFNDQPPQVFNNRAGTPTRVDVDSDKATGQGGWDFIAEVNTVLEPTPRLLLTVDRLGDAPFVEDVRILIGFPFDAFNNEDFGTTDFPNLFIGFETTDPAGDPGGSIPEDVAFTFTPDILSGTTHDFSLEIATSNAPNPVQFLAGHFDGTDVTGVQNVAAIGVHTDPVPATIELGISVDEDALVAPDPDGVNSFFDITWTASQASTVTFSYIEEEDGVPDATDDPPDYGTFLTFDQMPTFEQLSLAIDEDLNSISLMHTADAVIDQISLVHLREDGFGLTASLDDVPVSVELTIDTDPVVMLNVPPGPPTLDMKLHAVKLGGFLNTAAFFGYDIGYLAVELTDVPDLTAEWEDGTSRYVVQATNPGESIGQVSMVLDDGPVAVQNGVADVNGDESFDAADDAVLAGIRFIDGKADIDDDGDVDADDDGTALGFAPDVTIIDGGIDFTGDGVVDAQDDGLLTVLGLAPSWEDEPEHHIVSLVDDGLQGTVAGRLANVSTGALDLDGPDVIDGLLDMNADMVIDANDDGVVAVDRAVIDGAIDFDNSGVIDGADDGKDFGHVIIDGAIDLDDNEVVNAADDGVLSVQTFVVGTTSPAPMQAHLDTADTSLFFPGRDILATCDVDDFPSGDVRFQIVFPPPDINFNYTIAPPQTIDQVSCAGNVDNVHFELLVQQLPAYHFEFDFDPDSSLTMVAEDLPPPAQNSGTVGALVVRLCDDPDEDGVCEPGENGPVGLPGTEGLFDEVLHDARARADEIPSFQGRWGDAAAVAVDGRLDLDESTVIDGADDGRFGALRIINGRVDVDGDGSITGADDGRIAGKVVINGDIDVDGDGDVDGADDGPVAGSGVTFDTGVPDAALFLDGVQFDASTHVGLPALDPADPTSDHFVALSDEGPGAEKRIRAGAFGIDEFGFSSDDVDRGVALHYKANQDHRLLLDFDSAFGGRFFPQFDTDVNLTVDDVPQTWSFFTDLATELTYDGSAAIDSITIDGTIDDTDDADDTNGTVVDFDFNPLPASVAFHLAPTPVQVVNGALNVRAPAAIDADDDAIYAGVRIIDGFVDIDASGGIDGNDDGILVGVAVINGLLDTNRDGVVNGDDDGSLAGAMLRMSEAVDEISFSLTSTNAILGIPLQLIEFSVLDIPAHWDVNWGSGRFLVDARTAADVSSPMGGVNARVSTSSDPTTNDGKVLPFTLDGDQLGGAVLGAPGDSGGCRIDYSAFSQWIDQRYYSQGSPSVFSRLRDLYCDSEQLDPGEDHVLARLGGPALVDYASLQLSGFQHISWTPDSNGGQFILRAPTPGLHPLFGGFEVGGQFATLQVANIPDEIVVDIDQTKHVHYDAIDDLNASIIQVDAYFGPLPIAGDDDTAIRAVLNFDPGEPPTAGCVAGPPAAQCVRIDWGFGFPSGGVTFDTSEAIELLLLAQDGSNRIAGGLAFEDLHVGYFVDFPSLNGSDHVCIGVPDPTDGCIGVVLPTALSIVEASAGIDNDPADPMINANFGKPGVGGFLALYEHRNGPAPLIGTCGGGACPGPGAAEYLPLLTFQMANFRELSFNASIEVDPFPENIAVLGIIDIECCDLQIEGDFVFDVWSNVETDLTIDLDPLFGEIGFLNRADHTENDPFHIMPGLNDVVGNADFDIDHDAVVTFDGFHGFGSHVDPF